MSPDEKHAMCRSRLQMFSQAEYDMSENAKAIIRLFEHASDPVVVT